MDADIFELDRSSIAIPLHLRSVRYDAGRYPGASATRSLAGGANCQLYAYAVLEHHGFTLPGLRSRELWLDRDHTAMVDYMEPLDLVLVHDNPDSWGAHVGLCVGGTNVLHLSRKIGVPAIETLAALQERAEYRFLIGFKRPLRRAEIG